MLFEMPVRLDSLVMWCRSFRHGLQAGLDMPRVFELQAKSGPRELRTMASEIAVKLRAGEALRDTFDPYTRRFPPLFLEMVAVGEETGNLPEVFGQLEEYFALRKSLLNEFRASITLPVIVLCFAIFIIALLIAILGMIADSKGGKPIAPIGMGLTGITGAITFLLTIATSVGVVYVLYKMVQTNFALRSKIEGTLLKMPGVGKCIEAFAMNRFCTAFSMTMNSSMPVKKAVALSLRAAGNAHYESALEGIKASLKSGDDLGEAFAASRRFEERFVNVVQVGEASGRLPESMAQQAKMYAEEAAHQLKIVTKLAGFAVLFFYIAFMVICIFSIAGTYFGAIDNALGGM